MFAHYSLGVSSSASPTVDRVEQAFAEGGEDALQAAYKMYGDLVYTFCRRTLDEGPAKDVTQEVFISAFRSCKRFKPERGTLAAWLIAITKNRIIDHVRTEQRHDKRRSDASPDEVAVESQIEKTGDRLMVVEALRSLPSRPRQVIAMHYFEDLTHRQIAEKLSVPLGTVKSDLRRGISQIRRQLESAHG